MSVSAVSNSNERSNVECLTLDYQMYLACKLRAMFELTCALS